MDGLLLGGGRISFMAGTSSQMVDTKDRQEAIGSWFGTDKKDRFISNVIYAEALQAVQKVQLFKERHKIGDNELISRINCRESSRAPRLKAGWHQSFLFTRCWWLASWWWVLVGAGGRVRSRRYLSGY